MLEDGSFYELSFWKRLKLISQVKKLYNSLLGSMSSFKLKNILAAASILVFAAGCPDSGDSSPPPSENRIPKFAAAITNPFGLTDVGSYSSPVFVDIDGDGDLDAFIGERFGGIRYFENTDL